MNFLQGNFQSLCVCFWGPLATKKMLMPVYLSARSLLLETVGNWGLKDEDREKADIQARAEVGCGHVTFPAHGPGLGHSQAGETVSREEAE